MPCSGALLNTPLLHRNSFWTVVLESHTAADQKHWTCNRPRRHLYDKGFARTESSINGSATIPFEDDTGFLQRFACSENLFGSAANCPLPLGCHAPKQERLAKRCFAFTLLWLSTQTSSCVRLPRQSSVQHASMHAAGPDGKSIVDPSQALCMHRPSDVTELGFRHCLASGLPCHCWKVDCRVAAPDDVFSGMCSPQFFRCQTPAWHTQSRVLLAGLRRSPPGGSEGEFGASQRVEPWQLSWQDWSERLCRWDVQQPPTEASLKQESELLDRRC